MSVPMSSSITCDKVDSEIDDLRFQLEKLWDAVTHLVKEHLTKQTVVTDTILDFFKKMAASE